MEESKKINLKLGNISLSSQLGTYYIDKSEALIHYKPKNIWGGKFDKNGVPMLPNNNGDFYYSCVNIAQFALIKCDEFISNKSKSSLNTALNCLNQLEKIKIENEHVCVWYYNIYLKKYDIDPPWASAMAQGEIISLYLRLYQITKKNNLLQSAIKAYNFLKIPYKDGGVKRYDPDGNLWFEEYPSKKPSYVLNGFIYCLFGLIDLHRVTKKKDVKKDIDACIKTLKLNIHKYDAGYWSYYDLLKKELVRYYYQKNVHVLQLKALYRLTNEDVFKKYYEKWSRTLNPVNFLFVKIMYRIKPRTDKFLNKINRNVWKK